jgi:threonine synthase
MKNVLGLQCLRCKSEFDDKPMFDGCPVCRSQSFYSNVAPVYDYHLIKKQLNKNTLKQRKPSLWAFKELMPVDDEHIVTLKEGGTPLIRFDAFRRLWGLDHLYLKDETRNPTHSFKDRLASVSISKAKELGRKIVTTSSSGNHGAATAAYSARAGLECVIFTTDQVPQTMKTSMQIYGAKVIATESPYDRWSIMKKCIEKHRWYPASNYVYPPVGSNFYGIEGYKTIAFEICMELDWRVPDKVIVPTAYADGLSGIWRGFKEFFHLGWIEALPQMVAVEVQGSLKNALNKNSVKIEPVERKPTVAFSIATNFSTYQGLITLRESNGRSIVVKDHQLREMQNFLGRMGMYAEASSVASLAAVKNMLENGEIRTDETIVAVITSTGLKDPLMTAESFSDVPVIQPDLESLRQTLKDAYDFII